MKKIIGFLIIGLAILNFGCQKSLSPEEQLEKDITTIKKYITEKGLDAVKTDSGLHYVVTSEGFGEYPVKNDNVTVRYKGYFVDGKTFDESSEEGITFNLQQVIKGWTEGIQKFREGGSGILLIPSQLGYGDKNQGGIPANSVLIFDVEVLEIQS